ncbi:putative ABC transporter ATP-binding protein [Candidatus Mycoplasma haematolamae str. Purdue]|uniref:Putative ABC transporter ATP-binding protein n=1 Tax=Mycoplasma haematolamae (strain Purdue) TaxID=1212765 RepID=I7BII6_MYCHA|nr:ABC transporter ATP-binding protein [Candidatus Mycoplasma haematolamae]AFO51633.1 putative ABC transporter ATP-binding protein [Candidatus Mycoplasma haematolamae str. Purdue]
MKVKFFPKPGGFLEVTYEEKPRFKPLPKDKKLEYKYWLKGENQAKKRLRKQHTKSIVDKIVKLNKEHKGSIYYENSPGYVIECRNLEKWYVNEKTGEYNRVLRNLNLKVKSGELAVILGESGSGKTTLLNILSGMERASNGESIVFSHSLTTMNQHWLINFRAKYLSIIFQNYALIPELTVRENILVGQRIQKDARKRLDVDQIAEILKITPQLPKIPKALSGGQQQRVSIARALAKNPQLIFADEPTGAVDADTCKDILNIFVEINQKYKTTLVIITHNRLIAKIAHKVIHMEKGMITSTISQIPVHPNTIDWHMSS